MYTGFNKDYKGVVKKEKIEQVYIGHISKKISQKQLKKLLSLCGPIVKLSRSTNPVTNELASFCFVEYESLESIWRVINFLNDLELDNNKIIVKCPTKTHDLVRKWQRNRSYYLYKQNRVYTEEEIEEQFILAEAGTKSMLKKTIKEIEDAISLEETLDSVEHKRFKSNDLKKEIVFDNSDSFNRISQKSDQNIGINQRELKLPTIPYEQRYQFTDNQNCSILQSERERLERLERFKKKEDEFYHDLLKNWDRKIRNAIESAKNEETKILLNYTQSIPDTEILGNFIKCDFNDLNYAYTIDYYTSLGKCQVYPTSKRLINDFKKLFIDENRIPITNYHLNEIKKNRETIFKFCLINPNNEQYVFINKPKNPPLYLKTALNKLQEIVAGLIDISSIENEDDKNKKEVLFDVDNDHDSEITLEELKQWLNDKALQLMGEDQAEDFLFFILELFPPYSASFPTADELVEELRVFLENETINFVNNLYKYAKRCKNLRFSPTD